MSKFSSEAELGRMDNLDLANLLSRLLLEELTRALRQPKVSAANMATARAYLLQNALALEPIKLGSAMAKRLETLRAEYVKKLAAQVFGNDAMTASMFQECRLFLASEGLIKGGQYVPRAAPLDLADLELPFKSPPQ